MQKDGEYIPKIKVSESPEKITNPHFKKVYRLFDENGHAVADYVCVHDEELDTEHPITLTIFDPLATWKRCTLENVHAKEMLKQIFKDGKLVYQLPTIQEIRNHCKEQVDTLWDEVKRFENPHHYYVDLSQKLWDIKDRLLHEGGRLDR